MSRHTTESVDVIFHEGTTVVSTGAPFTVGYYQKLTIEIYGTASAATVDFKGMGPSGTPRTLIGIKLADLSTDTSGTIGDLWQFDITGLTTVIMDISVITGGNVTIKGKAVA